MASVGLALSIDFGTSNTVAVVRAADGRVRSLLFDGSPLLPSAIFAPPDGPLVVGRDALHHGRTTPGALEPHPKRLVDDGHVLLGAREVPVVEAIAAVLARVAAEARAVGPLGTVTLTHPAGWGPVRQLVLSDAAAAAGLGAVTLIAEPVAAAHCLTAADGATLVVFDFGAGTCDVSIVRAGAAGLAVVASDGLAVGGVDIDEALVRWLGERYAARAPDAWAGHRSALWEEVRTAKEMLSRAASAPLSVPVLGIDAPLTRVEFEEVAGPLVDRTVRATAGLLRAARVDPGEVAGLLLVGGSSRIPMVATALHRAIGVPATLTAAPELTVAEGGLSAVAPLREPAAEPVPPPAEPPPPRRRRVLLAAVVATVLLLGAVGVAYYGNDRDPLPPRTSPSTGVTPVAAGPGGAAAGDAAGPAPSRATGSGEPAPTRPAPPQSGPASAPTSTAPNSPPPSTNPPTVAMPKVVGLPEDKARAQIAGLNFDIRVEVTYITVGTRPAGVLDSKPAADAPLQRGQTVYLSVNAPNGPN